MTVYHEDTRNMKVPKRSLYKTFFVCFVLFVAS